jgi:Rhodopirellula transposase DDE domain
MIDIDAIRARFEALEPVLDERGRRLLAASEARAAGHGGVVAVSRATGIARSTIDRGLADLRSGAVMFSPRTRRQGGGGKPATETQPGLLETLNDLVQSAIRGDPEAALVWVSKSQRHLSAALAELGFTAGQKLVGRLLKRLGFSLQANAKTREGTSHPDRNAQFEHINAEVKAFQAAGEPVISVDTKKKEKKLLATSRMAAVSCVRRDSPSRSGRTTSPSLNSARWHRMASTTSPPMMDGSTSGSATTPLRLWWRAYGAGGRCSALPAIGPPSDF